MSLLALVTLLALHRASDQRDRAPGAASQATSLALTSSANALLRNRPDLALLLAARDQGLVAILHGHTDAVDSVAFSPDGRTLASGSDDATARWWTFARIGRSVPRCRATRTPSARWPPPETTGPYACSTHTHVRVGTSFHGHTAIVRDVAFSPDGGTLASASDDGSVRPWDVRSHREIQVPPTGHVASARAVTFSRYGRTLASVGANGTARPWHVRSHQLLGTLGGRGTRIVEAAITPAGRTVLTAGCRRQPHTVAGAAVAHPG